MIDVYVDTIGCFEATDYVEEWSQEDIEAIEMSCFDGWLELRNHDSDNEMERKVWGYKNYCINIAKDYVESQGDKADDYVLQVVMVNSSKGRVRVSKEIHVTTAKHVDTCTYTGRG